MSSPQNTLLQRDFLIVLAGQVISLFADGNALYLLTETYGRDAQKQVFSQYAWQRAR